MADYVDLWNHTSACTSAHWLCKVPHKRLSVCKELYLECQVCWEENMWSVLPPI